MFCFYFFIDYIRSVYLRSLRCCSTRCCPPPPQDLLSGSIPAPYSRNLFNPPPPLCRRNSLSSVVHAWAVLPHITTVRSLTLYLLVAHIRAGKKLFSIALQNAMQFCPFANQIFVIDWQNINTPHIQECPANYNLGS